MKIFEITGELSQEEQEQMLPEPDTRQLALDPNVIHPQQRLYRHPESKQIPIWATPQFQAWFQGSKIVDKEGRPLQVYHGTQAPEDFTEFSTGGSVATDDDEYHRSGSGADPRTFLGSHFARESHVASKFAKGLYGEREHNIEGGRVMPVYLRIIKPFMTSDTEMYDQMIEGSYDDDAVGWALETHGDFDEMGERYEVDPAFRAEINEYAIQHYDSDPPDYSLAEEMASQYRAKLMQQGYDGIIYKNEIEGGTSYIIFNSNQVKSAFNTGTFNPTTPDISESTFRSGRN